MRSYTFRRSYTRVSQEKDAFPKIQTAAELYQHLGALSKNAIIFLDVDDTIITPISKTFRISPYKEMIEEIKNNKDKYTNHDILVSHWRLERKIILVDPTWPQIIDQLKQTYPVYGLTKLDSGQFGAIESMELWRYAELKALGIEFSEDPSIPTGSIEDASFYKGLFITGKNSKSQTLAYYLRYLTAETFVVVDDKAENLESIQDGCYSQDINFIGILFQGLNRLENNVNPEIASLQKQHLIQHAHWLEDDAAQKLLNTDI